MIDTSNLDAVIQEKFLLLPKVVQDSITSTNLQQHLRDLANLHKLHLDQWEKLENEVIVTLLGVQRVEDLEQNIVGEVGVDSTTAHALAVSINAIVFEPIREELERQLEHPDAVSAFMSDTEVARERILDAEHAADTSATTPPAPPTVPLVQPATPPPPALEVKVSRPSESTAYKPGEASSERQNVHDDPYRVPPV